MKEFLMNNIEWIMGGGVLFIGITMIVGWIMFCNILLKLNSNQP